MIEVQSHEEGREFPYQFIVKNNTRGKLKDFDTIKLYLRAPQPSTPYGKKQGGLNVLWRYIPDRDSSISDYETDFYVTLLGDKKVYHLLKPEYFFEQYLRYARFLYNHEQSEEIQSHFYRTYKLLKKFTFDKIEEYMRMNDDFFKLQHIQVRYEKLIAELEDITSLERKPQRLDDLRSVYNIFNSLFYCVLIFFLADAFISSAN